MEFILSKSQSETNLFFASSIIRDLTDTKGLARSGQPSGRKKINNKLIHTKINIYTFLNICFLNKITYMADSVISNTEKLEWKGFYIENPSQVLKA